MLSLDCPRFTNFNSIKVRLEQTLAIALCVAVSDFNSIKVRLEQYFLSCYAARPYEFQFHKGTIRT